MAPDRGRRRRTDSPSTASSSHYEPILPLDEEEDASSQSVEPTRIDQPSLQSSLDPATHPTDSAEAYLATHASEPQNFTLRGVLVGLVIGIVICFSNTYFGLQTGWISGMSMPSALIGFAYFKVISKYLRNGLKFPFTPVENVLVQSVAGSVGTMPLGCGFVGVIPALEFLVKKSEGGPLNLSLWKLIVWAVGICFFGVFFAVPLRREVIIREKLKFPSGTATALMIGVLHGNEEEGTRGLLKEDEQSNSQERPEDEREGALENTSVIEDADESGLDSDPKSDWSAKIRLLIVSFAFSACYTLATYFIPQLRNVPIFGLQLATTWLWTLNPSPAYVGQGIIMGPATTLHMLLGAVIGWGILSPVAKRKGWAPGPVDDWGTGSKGWIVWISLAIMLADSLVSLGWLVLRPSIDYLRRNWPSIKSSAAEYNWKDLFSLNFPQADSGKGYVPISNSPGDNAQLTTSYSHRNSLDLERRSSPGLYLKQSLSSSPSSGPDLDAPPQHLVSNKTTFIGLILSLILSVLAINIAFPHTVPTYATLLSLLLALILSLMGVRALGETDLNPVSGISKLTQLIFAVVVPASKYPNAVIINLIAGAVSESGALQAGDLLQDLKAGHLLGAAPRAQFWGQIIGSAVGAVVSAAVYKLYTNVYTVPGGQFQVPTAYVWVFTARLVTGEGLPVNVGKFALGAGLIFAGFTCVRIFLGSERGGAGRWQALVPGGIAVAVGMYNVPSFTLARVAGGLMSWLWTKHGGTIVHVFGRLGLAKQTQGGETERDETTVVVVASGLILGEGVVSIVNLALASLNVPHL